MYDNLKFPMNHAIIMHRSSGIFRLNPEFLRLEQGDAKHKKLISNKIQEKIFFENEKVWNV